MCSSWFHDLRKKVSAMGEMMSLKDYRIRQLKDEEKIDRKLEHCYCKEKVQNYLLAMRHANRVMSRKVYEAPFYEYAHLTKENMDKINVIQQGLLRHEFPMIHVWCEMELEKATQEANYIAPKKNNPLEQSE